MTEAYSDLLIEVGTEELPPKSLFRLAEALADEVVRRLETAGLTCGVCHIYATPRRLALRIEAVPLLQPDRRTERRGPALNAAFDKEGKPTRAAEGFAKSVGLAVEALERLETDKGVWLCAYLHEPGRPTADLIPEILAASLGSLPIARRMRWGDKEAEFVRPVHWIVMLLGERVIDARILGVQSGRETLGHRVHHPEPLQIADPGSYAALLENEGYVLPGFHQRRKVIGEQVEALAESLGGLAMIDEALLDEVTALVEWPVAIAGDFDPRFLGVPHEVLITTMKDNQRYFPVMGRDGQLMPHFITVANLASADPGQIRAGNERVISPRLHDAEFFWQQDRRHSLVSRREMLKGVVFQSRLGTLYDRSERLAYLTSRIATELGASAEEGTRAGELSKCDLVTSMVFEFPELQGIMGRYYALHDGEPEAVARALEEQYLPSHSGGNLPGSPISQSLALADKMDALVGIFAIGGRPTGTKDPFALRRAALGVVRILIECGLDLDLPVVLALTGEAFGSQLDVKGTVDEVFEYIMERLAAYYAEQEVAADVVDAVLACRPTSLVDLDQRIKAVQVFRRMGEAESLAAANKRIKNILRQSETDWVSDVDEQWLQESAEKALFEALGKAEVETAPLFSGRHYGEALTHLAGLRDVVDRFFDETMVMAEDLRLKRNRVALLSRVSALFKRVADISHLQVVG